MKKTDELLHVAGQVMEVLARHRVDAVVIGGVALAAHHYVRLTYDMDLGVNANVEKLREIASSLTQAGFHVELREPDSQDPLGGVIDVKGLFGLLQIISFAGRFPAVIEDSLSASPVALCPGSALRIIPLPQLIALKLYAGGLKSKADILELLKRNPDADLKEVSDACKRYRLQGLDEIIDEWI